MTRWILIAGIFLLFIPVACSSAQPPAVTTKPTITASAPAPATSLARPPQAGSPATTPAAVSAAPAARVRGYGRLSFVDDRGLTFGTSGQIAKIQVKEMDEVKKGQLLASLDTSTLEQAVKTVEFALTAAELALKSATTDRKLAESGVSAAETDLKTLQTSVKSAGIDLQTATNSLAKISYPYTYTTFSIDIPTAITSIANAQLALNIAAADLQPGTTANYGDAQVKLDAAQTNLTAALQQLGKGVNPDTIVSRVSQSKGGVPSTTLSWATTDIWTLTAAQLAVDKAQLAVNNAQNAADKATLAVQNAQNALVKATITEDRSRNDLEKARNDLDKARTEMTKAVITAPFNGVVGKVNSKEMDLLTSGNYASTVIIQIVDPRRMELDININELDITGAKVGQKVDVKVDALPDQKIEGTVTSISLMPVVDGGIVSYPLKIAFEVPPNSPLKAGMAATAEIR